MATVAKACVALVVCGGLAQADPVVRFGMTSGADRNAPEGTEVGPQFAVGAGVGGFVGEVNYSYLSFMDPDSSIHRAGVALRMDAIRWGENPRNGYSKAIYLEVGAGKRWGRWLVNPIMDAYGSDQNEVHIGFGYELSRTWQLGVRLGASRRHPQLGTACRGIGCMVDPAVPGGISESVMAEWMWSYGR